VRKESLATSVYEYMKKLIFATYWPVIIGLSINDVKFCYLIPLDSETLLLESYKIYYQFYYQCVGIDLSAFEGKG